MKICRYKIDFVILHRETKTTIKTMKTKKQTTTYSSEEINRNFRIKVFGIVDGCKVNTLVGVKGLKRVLKGDTKRMMSFITRAFESGMDCTKCKIYGGATISFYVK